MTLEGAIKKVENVAHGDWKFNEHDYQDIIRFLKELKAKHDEELKSLGDRLRRDKKFIFTFHWSKGAVGNHTNETGTEQAVFIGHTILDAVNQYVDNVIHSGYDIAFIDYAVEE